MRCRSGALPPTSTLWVHEVKFDGWRDHGKPADCDSDALMRGLFVAIDKVSVVPSIGLVHAGMHKPERLN